MEEIDDYLRDRWKGHEKKLKEVLDVIRSDPEWHKSASYKDLMAALPPPPAETSKTTFAKRDLRGADLSATHLSKAYLSNTNLSGALLTMADLSDAHLMHADFSGAHMMHANLSSAHLGEANLSGAQLGGANLRGAHLGDAILSGAFLQQVLYTTDETFNRLVVWWGPQILRRIPFVKHLKEWELLGITYFGGVDTSKINGSTNPVLRRHIEDFQFILGFKEKSWFHRRVFYPLWKMTSDCGRSLLLWLIWSIGLVWLFTYFYSKHLNWFAQSSSAKLDWFNAFYFSIVTFATLGFGDLSPDLTNRAAQACLMVQVVIGYIMLGGLISILANKLARRA